MSRPSISSGRQDSNLRPPGPKPGALTGLRYAPSLFLFTPLAAILAERLGLEPRDRKPITA